MEPNCTGGDDALDDNLRWGGSYLGVCDDNGVVAVIDDTSVGEMLLEGRTAKFFGSWMNQQLSSY